jgi:hypothetical protein
MTCYIDGPDWSRVAKEVPYRHLVETPTLPPVRRPAPAAWEELHAWKSPREIHQQTGIPIELIAKAIRLRERNRKGGEAGEEKDDD